VEGIERVFHIVQCGALGILMVEQRIIEVEIDELDIHS